MMQLASLEVEAAAVGASRDVVDEVLRRAVLRAIRGARGDLRGWVDDLYAAQHLVIACWWVWRAVPVDEQAAVDAGRGLRVDRIRREMLQDVI